MEGSDSKAFTIPTVSPNIEVKIINKMNELRADKILCDISLQCDDGRKFFVHKLVLSAVSPYFRALFQTNMSEKDQFLINIKGIESESLDSLIEFAYTTSITVTIENIFSLLTAANMLCFEDVEKSCVDFLCKNLNLENCVDICTMAETINCEQLHRVATLYVSNNFRQFVRGTSFLNITPTQFESVLSSDKINVSSESEIYDAVMTWIKFDIDNRVQYLSIILKHVRFSLMSRKYLVDRVLHEKVIMQQESSRNIVLKAIDRHLLPERINVNTTDILPRQVTNKTLFVLGGEGKIVTIRSY